MLFRVDSLRFEVRRSARRKTLEITVDRGGDLILNFHFATILLPPSIIDYVIVHELVHLREPNHTPEFWLRVARVLPDYEERKTWLAQHGGGLAVL